MSSLWGRCFAAMYDPLLKRGEEQGNAARRAGLLEVSEGRVLELGAGTGLNLQHYPDGLELILTEPEEPMARKLENRLSGSRHNAEVHRAPAERLPLEDDSVDTVVSTLVLCTVEDQERTLAEVSRVLRATPTGRRSNRSTPRGSRSRISSAASWRRRSRSSSRSPGA